MATVILRRDQTAVRAPFLFVILSAYLLVCAWLPAAPAEPESGVVEHRVAFDLRLVPFMLHELAYDESEIYQPVTEVVYEPEYCGWEWTPPKRVPRNIPPGWTERLIGGLSFITPSELVDQHASSCDAAVGYLCSADMQIKFDYARIPSDLIYAEMGSGYRCTGRLEEMIIDGRPARLGFYEDHTRPATPRFEAAISLLDADDPLWPTRGLPLRFRVQCQREEQLEDAKKILMSIRFFPPVY